MYGNWIYNHLCNQCLSPLMLWVWTPLRWGVLDTTLCDKFYQWLAIGLWFSLGSAVSSTNKTDRHHIAEILLKVALNTIDLSQALWYKSYFYNALQLWASIHIPLLIFINNTNNIIIYTHLNIYLCVCMMYQPFTDHPSSSVYVNRYMYSAPPILCV